MVDIKVLLVIMTCLPAAVLLPFDPGPKDVTAMAGNNVTIPCLHPSKIVEADWVRVSPGTTTETEICLSTICLNGFAKRFSFDKTHNFRLTILNVTRDDNGDYSCIVYDEHQIRYTTTLNVNDRPVDILTSTTTSIAQSSTTAAPREADDLSTVAFTIGITAAVVVVVMATAMTIVLVRCIRRRKGFLSCHCFGTNEKRKIKLNENGIRQPRLDEIPIENHAEELPAKVIYEDEDRDSLCKIINDNDDECQGSKRQNVSPDEMNMQEQEKTITSVVSTTDGRLLIVSFLNLFRKFRNGNTKHLCVDETFKILGGINQQWLNSYLGRDVKQSIRRLLYYECSGYGTLATRMKPLQPACSARPVMGVAQLNGNMYSVHQESDSIHTLPYKTEIHVPGMKGPVDIVACDIIQGLYIADESRACIWRALINGDSEKWKEFDGLAPKALSLRAGSLLVTTDSNIIAKYSQNGKRIAKISLTMEIEHAVETKTNSFIVSCKTGRGYLVVEVCTDGRELRRFVCISQQLRFPRYLVLDGHEQLLVADFSNNRILLLDAKLKHAYYILNHQCDGIAAPHRLCLDQDTGHLLVVQLPSSSVAVYGVKKSACGAATPNTLHPA